MYSKILPRFEEMLKEIGDNTRFGPKLLYHSLSPEKVIVLEDLTECGYSLVSKRFLTFDEIKMAIKKLTKWYACSYIMNKNEPRFFEFFCHGVYNLPGLKEDPVVSKSIDRLTRLSKEEPILQKYTEKLEKVQDIILEKVFKTYETCNIKSKIQVLCHGDFHLKNLMFNFNSNNNGKPADVMMLDFQLSIWNSIGLDVIYSLYMMMDMKMSIEYEDEIVKLYYDEFEKNLRLLKYDGDLPTFSDYINDIDNLVHLRLFLGSTFMLFIALEQFDPTADPNDLVNPDIGDDFYMNLYRKKYYIDTIEKLLNKFDEKGYFEMLLKIDD